MKEMWAWSLSQKDPLEKEMVTHSRILAGKSHGQRCLVGLQFMGLQKSQTQQQHSLVIKYIASLLGQKFWGQVLALLLRSSMNISYFLTPKME